jgi:hypothetical protein
MIQDMQLMDVVTLQSWVCLMLVDRLLCCFSGVSPLSLYSKTFESCTSHNPASTRHTLNDHVTTRQMLQPP